MTGDLHTYLTERQLASRWQLSPRTLQRRRKAGHDPQWIQIGSRILYPLAGVLKLEASLLHGSEPD